MAIYKLAGRWRRRTLKLENGSAIELPPAPRIVAYIHCRKHHLSGTIEFLIDTGADYTTIMPDDRANIVIPDYALEHGYPEEMVGVGGHVSIGYLKDVTFRFQDISGQMIKAISLEQIGVLCPPHQIAKVYKGTPSLLGRDFLNKCRLDIAEDHIILHFEE